MFAFTRYGYCQDSCNEDPIIHAHPQYEIGYIHSGACSYMLGGRRIVVESGDLILSRAWSAASSSSTRS